MMLFVQYPPCSTCQKAKKWLEAQGIAYTERLIHQDNPTYEELKEWQQRSGLLPGIICVRLVNHTVLLKSCNATHRRFPA